MISAAKSRSCARLAGWLRCFLGTLTFEGESVASRENFVGLAVFYKILSAHANCTHDMTFTLPSNAKGALDASLGS